MWASEEAVRSRPLGLSGSAFDCRMDHAGDPTAIDEQAERQQHVKKFSFMKARALVLKGSLKKDRVPTSPPIKGTYTLLGTDG